MTTKVNPVILCILDGWGYSPKKEYNAIKLANSPAWDDLVKHHPHTFIRTDGEAVGLPEGQMGNSEVGHTNIGAGRIIYQDLLKITKAFANHEVEKNEFIQEAIKNLGSTSKAMHIMGLASKGGVHSHLQHLLGAVEIFAQAKVTVWLHLFTDGRDTPPVSFTEDLKQIEDVIKPYPHVKIATICGRYYAMDRDHRWERVATAYNAIVSAEGPTFATPKQALEAAYEQLNKDGPAVSDEFLPSTVIKGYPGMQNGDTLFMINFRSDRARQLLHALLDQDFTGFERHKIVAFTTPLGMVSYSKELDQELNTIFFTSDITHTLGEICEHEGLAQLHCAETEKYPHVTFFFNGGREKPYQGEDRILVPSPKVATYDLQPEMSAFELKDKLVDAINEEKYQFIVVNFANGDMVGHTGVLEAAVKAVEAVDQCLGELKTAAQKHGYTMLITADHGNSECLWDDQNNAPHTQHTTNPVRLIMFNPPANLAAAELSSGGKLADLAPTILEIMGLKQPPEMTGQSLIKKS